MPEPIIDPLKTTSSNPSDPSSNPSDPSSLLSTIQQQLLDQSGILSSNESEITNRVNASIDSIKTGTEASNKKLQSEFERNASYLGDKFNNDLTEGRAAGAGGIMNFAAFRSLVETTDKSLKDLAQRKEELVLQNNAKAAEKIADLEIKALETKQEASRQYFSNLLGFGNFALNVKNNQDNARNDLNKLIQDNPQAGILATDTPEQAAAKIAKNPNSPDVLYKKAQIDNIRSEIANRNKSTGTGGGTADERLANNIAGFRSVLLPGATYKTSSGVIEPTLDANGYVKPDAWKKLISQAPAKGMKRKDFISEFGDLLFKDKDGRADPKYGLTNVEQSYLTK